MLLLTLALALALAFTLQVVTRQHHCVWYSHVWYLHCKLFSHTNTPHYTLCCSYWHWRSLCKLSRTNTDGCGICFTNCFHTPTHPTTRFVVRTGIGICFANCHAPTLMGVTFTSQTVSTHQHTPLYALLFVLALASALQIVTHQH